jgi:non-specific serine/threonine protein kinase
VAVMIEQGRQRVYECGRWELDLARRELRARGVPVPLGSRAFQIFAVLVESAGKLVAKDELLARVWPGVIVEDNTLEVHICAIRKALGPDRGMLRTTFGRGYKLADNWAVRNQHAEARSGAHSPTRAPFQPFLTNVPATTFEVVGRASATRQLQDLLSAHRAVTLTGPGGNGKTTLALEVVRSVFPSLNGDCWLVDLASLSDSRLVPSMVAGVLGLKLGGVEISPESVARAIGRERLLLVLDNCEHVIDAAARLAETVIRLCPATTIMATSREALRIEGERIFRVAPLDVPSPHQEQSGDVFEYCAVELFIARMSGLNPAFSPTSESLRAIAAICRRLDGMPLAIELAAARAAALGLELVLGGLDARFELLTSGRRTALGRHQSLRATLDWSYELLPEPERCLLRRMGIFSAGFTFEAANAVVSDQGHTPAVVLRGITHLIAKSLLEWDGPAPSGRWRMLETTRAYALEKLAQHGELEQTARRYAEFCRDHVRATSHNLCDNANIVRTTESNGMPQGRIANIALPILAMNSLPEICL